MRGLRIIKQVKEEACKGCKHRLGKSPFFRCGNIKSEQFKHPVSAGWFCGHKERKKIKL